MLMNNINIFKYIIPKTDEDFTALLKHKNIKINRIVSSDNHEEKEYIQDEDEWLVLLEGGVTLLVNNDEKVLKKGDTLFIAAKVPHTVLDTSHGAVWLTVHIF